MTDAPQDGKKGYGHVSTNAANEVFALVEKFGDRDKQYAVILSALIGFAKAMGEDRAQVLADVRANWLRVPAPQDVLEH